MTGHLFRAKGQPATAHRVPGIDHLFRFRRRQALWAQCCNRRRWAAYLVAHAYYDGTYFFCRPGHGCKVTR